MTYLESANGIIITKRRALQELKAHGADEELIEQFFQELGDKEEYKATDVLLFLGY